MSHQDIVYKIPIGFKKIASTSSSPLTIIENKKKRFWCSVSSRSNPHH